MIYKEELHIDYTKHTMFFRTRFVVTIRKDGAEDKYYFSDWSDITSVGKDAEKHKLLTQEDLKAPVIADLHMTDKEFNDNPVVAFTLTVPEELAKNASMVTAGGGGIVIETEARVKGDADWTPMGNTDWIIKSGEMECALISLISDERPVIEKDTEIELRCRYRCDQPGVDELYSDYSEVITFGTTDIKTDNSPVSDEASVESEAESKTESKTESKVVSEPEKPAEQKDSCPLCHFCPQPLGLCIFIWILIAVAVVVVIVVVIVIVKKKNKKENK